MSNRKKGYDVQPEDDMTKHGWRKSKKYLYLKILENGKIRCLEYHFYVEDIKHECGSTEYLWLSGQRSGMLLICTWCKSVEPIGRDFGRKAGERIVDVNEAIEILKAQGWKQSDMPMRPYLKKRRGSKPRDMIKRKPPSD